MYNYNILLYTSCAFVCISFDSFSSLFMDFSYFALNSVL